MSRLVFLLLTVGDFAVVLLPVFAGILRLNGWDWFGLGLSISALSGTAICLWALVALRHDHFMSEGERTTLRPRVFFTKFLGVPTFDPFLLPWFYLRDRVFGRDTRKWVERLGS